VGDQDLARHRRVGQAGGEVHRVAGDRVFPVRVAAGAARHDLTARHADMRGERPAGRSRQLGHRATDGDGRGHGAGRIVAVSDGSAEHRHDVVADVLVDMAAMVRHRAIHPPEEGIQQRVHVLSVELARQRRVAREIGEEDADLTPLAFRLRRGGRLRSSYPQRGDRFQQPATMADRRDAEFLEIVSREQRSAAASTALSAKDWA
jgi:hypothetical protein